MSSAYSTFFGLMAAMALGSLSLASAVQLEAHSSGPDAAVASAIVRAKGIDSNSEHAFVKAFTVVAFAEMFDKTWFVTLILALRHGKRYAFFSSFAALAVHTVLAAALGLEIARLFRPSTIDFMTAALFALFTLLYAKDAYYADPDADMLKSGREEAGDCIKSEDQTGSSYASVTNTAATTKQSLSSLLSRHFGGFMLVAFALLCLTAVCVADIVANRSISERHVFGVVSVSFSIFALLALRSGFADKAAGK